MSLLTGFDIGSDGAGANRGGYVSIGNFDGVHCGHRAMLSQLRERATADGVPAVVLTFDPHPIEVLRPEFAPPRLTTISRRMELLTQCGVDQVIVFPTTPAFLAQTPQQFFEEIVLRQLQARGLIEGENFQYGLNRAGNIETLRASCESAGISLDVVPSAWMHGKVISSSLIRNAIQAGGVSQAADYLGEAYQVTGTVVTGAARGRQLGFPTANLAEIQTLLPAEGVYAGSAVIDGQRYWAAMNVGPNPTFAEEQQKFEVHLLDFTGDLYGQPLTVSFLKRLRDTVRFSGLDALLLQLKQDVEAVRALAAPPVPE